MVKNAGLGVAMGNAHPDLLKCAKRIIGRNNEDGLAVFLEELLATHAVQPADPSQRRYDAARMRITEGCERSRRL